MHVALTTLSSQTLEPTVAKQGKEAKKQKGSSPAHPTDPLSGSDPLSLSPASDPLSAALFDPLSHAVTDSFGGKQKVGSN